MSGGPNKVIRTKRSVIEKRLLDGLSDGEHVAILASKEDLDLLIEALRYFTGINGGSCPPATKFADGLEQLRREAFPKH